MRGRGVTERTMRLISDADILDVLRRGQLRHDLVRTRETREKNRIENAKKLVAEREAAIKKFDRDFPALEHAEAASLEQFREVSRRFEAARAETDGAYNARVAAQSEIDRRVDKYNAELICSANPLLRELVAKVSEIVSAARKIETESDVVRPENSQKMSFVGPRAAREARAFSAPRISGALSELVLAGADSDQNLRSVFDAGLAALPSGIGLRLIDGATARNSAVHERAMRDFAAARSRAGCGAQRCDEGCEP